jgi:hypothetical protein
MTRNCKYFVNLYCRSDNFVFRNFSIVNLALNCKVFYFSLIWGLSRALTCIITLITQNNEERPIAHRPVK